jgi:hypothetical protein
MNLEKKIKQFLEAFEAMDQLLLVSQSHHPNYQ